MNNYILGTFYVLETISPYQPDHLCPIQILPASNAVQISIRHLMCASIFRPKKRSNIREQRRGGWKSINIEKYFVVKKMRARNLVSDDLRKRLP